MGKQVLNVLTPKICELISKGLNKTQIAKNLGVSRATMHRYFKELENNAVIKREFRGAFVKYKVRQSFIFTIGDKKGKSYKKFFRFHHFGVKFPLILDSKIPFDRKVNLKSGEQFLWSNKRFGWSVRKTAKNLVVWVNKPLYGGNALELKRKAWKEAEAVRNYFESKFGLVLGDGVQVGKEHLACEDVLASKLHRDGKTFSNSLIDVDNSPPCQGRGELDLKGAGLADSYSQMPLRVERIEDSLDRLNALIQGDVNFSQKLNKLMAIIANQQEQINFLLKQGGSFK